MFFSLITDQEKYSTIIYNSLCSFNFPLKYSDFKRGWSPYAKSSASSDKTCKISFWFKEKKMALVVKFVGMVFYMWETVLFIFYLVIQ